MRIDFHINFSGQCQEAFELYQSILGGSIELLTYGNSPTAKDVPPSWRNKIIHGSFKLHNLDIAGADVLPEQYQRPQGFQLLLQLESEPDSHRIFNAFAKDGFVKLPLQKTFWSPCYGIVVDKFGIGWEINYAAPKE